MENQNNTVISAAVESAIAELAALIVKDAYTFGKDKLKRLLNGKKRECKNAYATYLKKAYKEFSRVKTLLYRTTPMPFDSFFVMPTLIEKHCDKKNTIKVNDTKELFQKFNRMLVIGSGGMGKSMLLKYFFLETLKGAEKIPVLIPLRTIDSTEKDDFLIEAIYNSLSLYGYNIDIDIFEETLSLGKYVFLFDGFDEIKNGLESDVQSAIINLSIKYDQNTIVVSSRPDEQRFLCWNTFTNLYSNPLDEAKAISMIKKLEIGEKTKEAFIKALQDGGFAKYKSFASNPLLLTILLMSFTASSELPNEKTDFYNEAFDVLYNHHDATKDNWTREKKSRLSNEEFKRLFAHFCFQTLMESDFEMSQQKAINYIEKGKEKIFPFEDFTAQDFFDDLIHTVCLLFKDGVNYSFIHRSFQEYFAALYINSFTDTTEQKFFSTLRTKFNDKQPHKFITLFRMLKSLNSQRYNVNLVYPSFAEFANFDSDESDESFKSFLKMFVANVVFDAYGNIIRYTLQDTFELTMLLADSTFYDLMFESALHPKKSNIAKYIPGFTTFEDKDSTYFYEIRNVMGFDAFLQLLKASFSRGFGKFRLLIDDVKNDVQEEATEKVDFSNF